MAVTIFGNFRLALGPYFSRYSTSFVREKMITEAAFPIIKLATLGIKQISKPISKGIKQLGKNNPTFGRRVCAPPAQLYHWLDVNLRMRILGLGKATEVAPLSEEAAVELGAEMIGETFIFTVAVGCLAFEYWRQARKEAKHENKQTDAIDRLESRVNELGMLLEQQDARLREMNRIILTRTPASKSS
ncbi:hypothetical protein BSL78_21805 [Apostichopus japonicus]|uniref:Optic atrophy 3 protein-like n=1 Tax=Stichopus japonicus TaxID=307972 RepID=A0A2G8JZZ5_STIJA|nr:hypothetical protein BSL78_21805 [Apostichopus japonicus]